MDSTLLAVIVGAGLPALSGLLNHWLATQKEEKQWQRQQIIEEKKLKREEEEKQQELLQKRRDDLKEAYLNSLIYLRLILFSNAEEKIKPDNIEVWQFYQEANHWLAKLSFQSSEQPIMDESDVDDFTSLKRYLELFQNGLLVFTREPKVEQVDELAGLISHLFQIDYRIKS